MHFVCVFLCYYEWLILCTGYHALGHTGRVLVDIAIVISQTGMYSGTSLIQTLTVQKPQFPDTTEMLNPQS